jgi:hypothetical protein
MFFFAAAEPGRFDGGLVRRSSSDPAPWDARFVGGLGRASSCMIDCNLLVGAEGAAVCAMSGAGVELIDGGFVTAARCIGTLLRGTDDAAGDTVWARGGGARLGMIASGFV